MDPTRPQPPSARKTLLELFLPPLAVWRIWNDPERSGWGRVALTLLFFLYSLAYVGVFLFLGMQLGLVQLEWRGGFPPVLTFHKTLPDYDAVDAHRGSLTSLPPATTTNAVETYGTAYWTGFRGPRRDGHYTESPIQTDWPSEGLAPLWKQPIGGGYGSFAMAQGLAYTIEQRRDREAITAYDILTGREVWIYDYPARFEESMGGEGPRSTPTWEAGRLYALGAMGDLHCLDATSGQLLWSHALLPEQNAENLYFGCSASPLLVDDKVVVVGGEGAYSLLAFDKIDGRLLWSTVPEKPAYTSPMLVTLAGRRQVLAPSALHALAVDPEEGTILWRFPWEVQHDLTIAQPILIGTNQIVLSAGYNKGAALLEINHQEDGGMSARQVWANRFLKNKFTSSVYHDGYLYGLDESILTCLDAQTGQRQWKDGRYDYGQLIVADGHLIILSGTGQLALVRATPERWEERALFQAIQGKTWNHPALGDGYLLVRNAVEMACFDIGVRRGE